MSFKLHCIIIFCLFVSTVGTHANLSISEETAGSYPPLKMKEPPIKGRDQTSGEPCWMQFYERDSQNRPFKVKVSFVPGILFTVTPFPRQNPVYYTAFSQGFQVSFVMDIILRSRFKPEEGYSLFKVEEIRRFSKKVIRHRCILEKETLPEES